MKRSLLAGLGAAAFGAVLALPAAPAAASPKAAVPSAVSPDAIAASAPVAYTRWRGHRGYGWRGHRGYGYRYGYYRRHRGGAIAAGAVLGLIGGIATAAAANSYDYPYYGGYGYYPAYGYSYAYPSYGYAYPAAYYGGGYRRAWYPRSYGYVYGGGWRRAGWGGGYHGVRFRSGGWRW